MKGHQSGDGDDEICDPVKELRIRWYRSPSADHRYLVRCPQPDDAQAAQPRDYQERPHRDTHDRPECGKDYPKSITSYANRVSDRSRLPAALDVPRLTI